MSADVVKVCRSPLPSSGDACGKPATYVVTFKDGDKLLACHACALILEQLAATHGHDARVKVQKLESSKP